jgi:hypothetical protein
VRPPRTRSRLLARFRLHMQQPASDAVTRVLDLEGSESVRWLLGRGHSNTVPSGSPATDRVLGEVNILDQLRDNVEVDERGLATLLRALELIRESVPDFQTHGARMAFDPTVNDEIGAVKQYMAALDLVCDDCAHPAPEYVAPLPLESQDLFETWAPPEAVERWGFIVAAFCTPNLKAKADTLRRSLQQFGMPHTFQEVSTVHPTLSARGVGGPALTKPNFIHAMLERHQLPVLYMDCDLVVMDEPVHVQEALRGGYDWGICNFLAAEVFTMSSPLLGESNRYSLTVNCDGVRFLTREQLHSNAAINIWNNTEGARRVLRRWHQELVFYTNAISFQVTSDPANGVGVWTVADDNVLDWLWNNRSKLYRGELLDVKPYWLPLSYARLPIWSFVAPIVNHPEYCSEGPRMKVAAHRGTRKAHYDNSSPQKTWAALMTLGVPRGCFVFDMEKRMAGRRTREGGEIQYDIEIKTQLYPPGMVEWGALGGPPSQTANH